MTMRIKQLPDKKQEENNNGMVYRIVEHTIAYLKYT